jgi:hypothetical protein
MDLPSICENCLEPVTIRSSLHETQEDSNRTSELMNALRNSWTSHWCSESDMFMRGGDLMLFCINSVISYQRNPNARCAPSDGHLASIIAPSRHKISCHVIDHYDQHSESQTDKNAQRISPSGYAGPDHHWRRNNSPLEEPHQHEEPPELIP